MTQRTVTLTRDQAVWERETYEIGIPDDVPEGEIENYALAQVDAGKAREVRSPYILDAAVECVDTTVEVQMNAEVSA